MTRHTQETQGVSAEGNTNTSAETSRSRAWCFTLNNYEEEQYKELENLFTSKGWTYVIGKEVGKMGTPHLQGYIRHKNAIAFTYLKKIMPTAHFEKSRGTMEQNITYCTKEGNFKTNVKLKRPLIDPLAGKDLYPYQQEIVDLVKEDPDDRKIYWYWEPEGNMGKTALAKHLCIEHKHEILFVGGKGSDIKYAVKSFQENEENDLRACIFHFTRSVENYVSYEAIESIKDGIFFNAKYESSMVIINPPHIVILANFAPDTSKLSSDRWIIKEVTRQ